MLEQVDLPGEVSHSCLVKATTEAVDRMFHSYFPKSLEFTVVIRITQVLRQPPKQDEHAYFPRLSIHPRLLATPLRSSHLIQTP